MVKTVMVFGTFDILHPGHLNFFTQAKKIGQQLIVVIARDGTTQKVKGRLPLNSEKDRQKLVAALAIVDKTVLGNRLDPMKVVYDYKPNVICLGYDQKSFVDILKQTFPRKKIVRLKSYKPKYYKSSKLI